MTVDQESLSLLFIFNPFSTWSWLDTIVFTVSTLLAIEGLNWGVFWLFENHTRERIPPAGQSLFDRSIIWDYSFIVFNKLCTVLFIYHLIQYLFWHPSVPRELTIYNTIIAFPLLYIFFDFFYGLFHRTLHHHSIYRFIHKHHHSEISPVHGHDDAVNTHPIEFIIGEYNHLWSIYVINPHPITAVLFVAIGGIMASLSHTRFDMQFSILGMTIYSVKEHDAHHKYLTANYCQYTGLWDQIFNTRVIWRIPEYFSQATSLLRWNQLPNIDGGGPNREEEVISKSIVESGSASSSSSSQVNHVHLTHVLTERSFVGKYAKQHFALTNANTPSGHALLDLLFSYGVQKITCFVSVEQECDQLKRRQQMCPMWGEIVPIYVDYLKPSSISIINRALESVNVLLLNVANNYIPHPYHLGEGLHHTPCNYPQQTYRQHSAGIAHLMYAASLSPTLSHTILLSDATAGVEDTFNPYDETIRQTDEGYAEKVKRTGGVPRLSSANTPSRDTTTTTTPSSLEARAPSFTYGQFMTFIESIVLRYNGAMSGITDTLALQSTYTSSRTTPLVTAVLSSPNLYGNGVFHPLIQMVRGSLLFKEHIFSSGNNKVALTNINNVVYALLQFLAQTGLGHSERRQHALNQGLTPDMLSSSSTPPEGSDAPLRTPLDADKAPSLHPHFFYLCDDRRVYLWDVIERIRLHMGLSTVWDCFHIYNHTLYLIYLAKWFYAKTQLFITKINSRTEGSNGGHASVGGTSTPNNAMASPEGLESRIKTAASPAKTPVLPSAGRTSVGASNASPNPIAPGSPGGKTGPQLTVLMDKSYPMLGQFNLNTINFLTKSSTYDMTRIQKDVGYSPLKPFPDLFYGAYLDEFIKLCKSNASHGGPLQDIGDALVQHTIARQKNSLNGDIQGTEKNIRS